MTLSKVSPPDFTEAEMAEMVAALIHEFGTPAEQSAVPVTIHLDQGVVDAFQAAAGEAWQDRMNDTLKRAAKRLGQR
jgi:uncharacterized protein (DUF4415 family)